MAWRTREDCVNLAKSEVYASNPSIKRPIRLNGLARKAPSFPNQDKSRTGHEPDNRRKSTFGTYADPRHKAASRALGYGLTQYDEVAAWQFAIILSLRLTRAERLWLAFAALVALDEGDSNTIREIAP